MTEAARDLNVLPATTTEGLEDLFSVADKSSESGAGPSRDEGPADCVLVDIEDAGPSQFVASPTHDEGPAQTAQVETPEMVLDAHKLLKELEGATYRIGYLEAQLEAERNQVKLLTDALHKPVWWRRAWSWFVGAK